MRFYTLLLAAPLALGYGVAVAQVSTTTETTTSRPVMPSQTTTTNSERVTPSGAIVERNSTTYDNPDGSTTIDRSKTITRP